jgi:hypothetical protein
MCHPLIAIWYEREPWREAGKKQGIVIISILQAIYQVKWGQIFENVSMLPSLLKTVFLEEVRIPGTNQIILQAIFLPSGNLKDKSQPGLADVGEAKRRPR